MNTDTEEDNYYDQLHETARTYQSQIWGVPVVFFALQGVILHELDYNLFFIFKNAILLLVNGLFSYILFLQFTKTYYLGLLIQKKISTIDKEINNKYDHKDKKFIRIPLYSLRPGKFLYELEKNKIELNIAGRKAIISRVGIEFSFIIRFIYLGSFTVSIIILIYKIWLTIV